ncbi:MAG TPA: histidine ammonia-lyase [Casimicrobiaceae bacterium]|nr:histidine ammonia-lyase [Casimicrobiaceae bacterium]
MSTPTIALAGGGVRIADVVRVARRDAPVALAPGTLARVAAAREAVDRLAASDTLVYGVTSALGANTGKPIAESERVAYQLRAVRARAVGVGPRHPRDVVRAMLFARAAGMAMGGSGASPEVLEALVAMLNAKVHPVVPSRGSIGVADLAPLSHLALPLVGEGEAEHGGDVIPGAEALRRASLSPIELAPKDGLALISANAATVGHAALVLSDCAEALDALDVSAALAFEGFRANLTPLDPRVQAARPARGQVEIAERLRELLAGSALWQPSAARRVQDPISFRCVTQVHGAALSALRTARDDVELELNSAADSPLAVDGELLSNGNFHVPALALAFDGAGLALAHAAHLCVARCQRLYTPAMSGLPLQLTTLGPEHSGFATIQKTLTALANEIRHLANPASLDSLPVSEAVEDHAPMTANVVAKTAAIVPLLHVISAIELLSAAQAIDLRKLDRAALGRGAAAAYDAVRTLVPMLVEDRPLGSDVETAAAMIAAGRLPLRDLLDG